MDFYTIDILSACNPETKLPKVALGALGAMGAKPDRLHYAARDRFIDKYAKPHFGWDIAQKFAAYRMPFPLPLLGRDQWVYKAYLMQLDPDNNFDEHIAEAYHMFYFFRGSPYLGQHMRALLLSFSDTFVHANTHILEIHRKTGVPIKTIEAFESLFYNVIDRRHDGIYLAYEVYPDTRAVEYDENYLKNSSFSDLLRRVAYNHRNMDLTAYLAGIGDHTYLKKLAASEDRESDLTRYIMGNGLLLAQANLLNQRSVGLSRVSSLLAASRQGGAEVEEPTLTGMPSLYSDAYKRARDFNRDKVMKQMRVDAGVAPAIDV